MMAGDVLGEEEILRRVNRLYDESPKGWRIYSGRSKNGNPELIVTGEENWHIIRDRYSGRPGLGIKLGNSAEPTSDAIYAGLRPVPNSVMNLLIDMISKGADLSVINRVMYESTRRIVGMEDPVSHEQIERIKPPAIISGPILTSPNPLHGIIRGQEELDAKLNEELERMKRKFASGYIG